MITESISNAGIIQLFDSIAAPWIIFDKSLKIHHVNPHFSKLLRRDAAFFIHKSLTDIMKFRVPDTELQALLHNCRQGEQPKPGLHLKPGVCGENPVPARLMMMAVGENGGEFFAGLLGLTPENNSSVRPDVSDRHLFRLLLDELPDAIYFKDLKGRFFLTNQLHIRKLGFKTVEEFSGKTDFDLFTDEHARQAFDDEQAIIRTGQSISKEEKETHLDGAVTWASTSKMPLRDTHGNIVGTFGISKDITRIKTVEQELRQTQKKLVEANAAKDMFFSIIAHDLKNPFNSLIGLSDLMIGDFDEMDDDEKMEMLQSIHGISESTYNLLENLLDWSRLQSGAMEVDPEQLSPAEIATDVISLLEGQALAKKITIRNTIDPEISLFADKNMVRTILRNLVSNAVKFTYPGGHVLIKAAAATGYTLLKVKDNGIGISAENIAKLFRLSQMVKTYGTADESGTGLGLILCHDFARKNHGNISVESTPGSGSTFSVKLPASQKDWDASSDTTASVNPV